MKDMAHRQPHAHRAEVPQRFAYRAAELLVLVAVVAVFVYAFFFR